MRAANPCSRNKKNCFCPISVFFMDVCDGAPSCWKVKGLSLKYFLALTAFITFSVRKICSLPLPGQSSCTNQQPPQCGGAVPGPVWVGSKWLLAFPRVPVTSGTPLHFFAMLPPERPQKGSTQLLQNRSLVFCFSFLLPLSCPSSSPPSLDEQ